jgi:hypothetical protein
MNSSGQCLSSHILAVGPNPRPSKEFIFQDFRGPLFSDDCAPYDSDRERQVGYAPQLHVLDTTSFATKGPYQPSRRQMNAMPSVRLLWHGGKADGPTQI